MKNAALSKALKWLLIAQLLSIVALLPLVYDLKILLRAAAGLLTLAALVKAAREASGYRAALGLHVADLALDVLSYVLLRWLIFVLVTMFGTWAIQTVGALSALLSIAGLVLGLLLLRQICLTTAGLVDDPNLAARGIWVWRVNLICTVAGIVLTIGVSALLKMGLDMEKLLGLSTAVTLLSAVIELAGNAVYLHFLWQSARCLSAPD
ncbi:hypothetical protein [uncultured Intestinimonas sp.]|uniref:hypothetical protein n=1 Tax=uncultured Intestinimonas sp. TaxID=1689265 RepID=UPI0025FF60A5|nr:hypothetical protein [uncultured Intestinimonas sp.]